MNHSVGVLAFRFLPFARCQIVRWCAVFGPQDFNHILALAIKDKNPKVRYETIKTITKHKAWSAIYQVISVLKDPNISVRLAAICLLAQSGVPHVSDFIYRALDDPDSRVKIRAIMALKEFPKPKYRSGIQTLVHDRDVHVRSAALETLLTIRCSEGFTSALLDLALDPKQPPEIQKKAFENIRQAERLPMQLIHQLYKVGLENNDIALHQEIVEILAVYPPGNEMQRTLIQLLHHITPKVRYMVIIALGDKGNREAIFFLSEIERDGQRSSNLLKQNDARLARLAIQKIEKRYPLPQPERVRVF
jgi:HEAT repeat protein